jgi:methionyl-tRNA formyltransferase
MRLAFMGTPDFAVVALKALVAAGHEIVCVYCQPPRPAGRGQRVRLQPVHQAAEDMRIMVRTPLRLRREMADWAAFRDLDLDAAVVAAYGLILPQQMLEAPRRGCLNIHASLLPRWRGAAPIQAAILAGDSETGVTIMQMDAGLDTGAMLLEGRVPITPTTTGGLLHDQLAELGGRLIVQALAQPCEARAQPEHGVTYAGKIMREDGRIDWQMTAEAIDRRVRAFDPWPGSFTMLGEDTLKILAVARVEGAGPPGTTLDDRLTIGTGSGALRITRLQAPGRAAMEASAFLNGRAVPAGTHLG